MPRVVIKTAQGPVKIAAKDVDKYICMCGLSKNKPFCDGSHKKTLDEKADSLYQYDEAGKREELDVEDGGCEDCCGDKCCQESCCGDKCQDGDCKDCCGDSECGNCGDCGDHKKSTSAAKVAKSKPAKKSKVVKK